MPLDLLEEAVIRDPIRCVMSLMTSQLLHCFWVCSFCGFIGDPTIFPLWLWLCWKRKYVLLYLGLLVCQMLLSLFSCKHIVWLIWMKYFIICRKNLQMKFFLRVHLFWSVCNNSALLFKKRKNPVFLE